LEFKYASATPSINRSLVLDKTAMVQGIESFVAHFGGRRKRAYWTNGWGGPLL